MSDSIAEYTVDTAVTRRPHPRIARPRETANTYEEKSAKNTEQVNSEQDQPEKVDQVILNVSDPPKQKGKQPKRKSKKGKKAKQDKSKKQLKEDESTDDEHNSSADEKHHKKGVWQSFKRLFSRKKKDKHRKQQTANDTSAHTDKVKEDLSRECSCSCSAKAAEECKDQSNYNMDNPQIGMDQPKISKKKPLKSIEKDQGPKMLRRFRYTSDGILPQKVLPSVAHEDSTVEVTTRQHCFVSYTHEESEDTDDLLQWEGLYDNTPAVQESRKIVRFAKPPLIIPSCTPTTVSPAFLDWAQAGRMHMRDMGRMDGQANPMTPKMLRKSRYTSEGILPSTSRLGRVRRVQLH